MFGGRTYLNRLILQELAERYFEDARILLAEGRWASAYYLGGYSIECALKSCIAAHTRGSDFPDKAFAINIHTHEIVKLAGFAGLTPNLEARGGESPEFTAKWKVVTEWSPESRYDTRSEGEARSLIQAIGDTEEGILPWIKLYW